VAHIDAVVRGSDFREGDDLVGFGKGTGHVDQTGAQADRAVLHRLIDEGLHRRELCFIRCADENAAHALLAHGAMTDQRGDIDGDSGLLELFEKLRHVGARIAAVAGDDGCHAHAQEILRNGYLADVLRMRVNVDETRRGHLSARVDGLIGGTLGFPDGDNLSALHADAAFHQRRTTAIGDSRILDEEVEIRRRGGSSEQKGEKEAQLHGAGKDVAHGADFANSFANPACAFHNSAPCPISRTRKSPCSKADPALNAKCRSKPPKASPRRCATRERT